HPDLPDALLPIWAFRGIGVPNTYRVLADIRRGLRELWPPGAGGTSQPSQTSNRARTLLRAVARDPGNLAPPDRLVSLDDQITTIFRVGIAQEAMDLEPLFYYVRGRYWGLLLRLRAKS